MTTARFTQSPISQTLAPIPCMARKAGQTGNKLNSKVLQGDAETMTPLPSLSRLQPLVQQAQQFDISDKTPWSLIDKARRNLAYEALYAKGRAQALKHIHEKVKVLLKAEVVFSHIIRVCVSDLSEVIGLVINAGYLLLELGHDRSENDKL